MIIMKFTLSVSLYIMWNLQHSNLYSNFDFKLSFTSNLGKTFSRGCSGYLTLASSITGVAN